MCRTITVMQLFSAGDWNYIPAEISAKVFPEIFGLGDFEPIPELRVALASAMGDERIYTYSFRNVPMLLVAMKGDKSKRIVVNKITYAACIGNILCSKSEFDGKASATDIVVWEGKQVFWKETDHVS